MLENDRDTCEFRIRDVDAAGGRKDDDHTSPVLEAPTERPRLWGSLSLDIDDVRDLMAMRRMQLVGVLGTPAAGKTAALVSLYLLLAHGKLEGFQYADSLTLMALEEITQGARRWGPAPPDEMTARTEQTDGRSAGFLHFQMKQESGGLIDFIIPDLPGEWSDALIETKHVDRLDFLHSADVIWLFVNGMELRQPAQRMRAISRAKSLLRRLVEMMVDGMPPIKIVVTHADLGALPEKTKRNLEAIFDGVATAVDILEISSFPGEGKVPVGLGIAALISESLPQPSKRPVTWASKEPVASRFILRYANSEPRP
ncbi:TRAFAC clade GTPase domain-containing protein [Blastomonas fulva]|uniref:Double-GTPase 2 domain-containing protein n=1 Tax=Blastomonas fulva TaxID=1550728 RepID=A0ABN5BA20_9SPHN|nr:hypothetical protein [Blastomonas fulva]ASR53156.1 hypothetical protein B5J99_18215 [Blastomonas fulva]